MALRYDGKRFSYPRVSKHCKTCDCHRDRENEALFESESASKASPSFSDSWAKLKPRADTENEGQRMQMRCSFKYKKQDSV